MLLKRKVMPLFLSLSLILPNLGIVYSYAEEQSEMNEIKSELKAENNQKEKVLNQLLEKFNLDIADGNAVAKQVSKYKLDKNFEYAVKNVLDYYYENDKEKDIEKFKKEIDSRANELIKEYEQAQKERNQKDLKLGYEPGTVLVEFEDNVSDSLKEVLLENLDAKIESKSINNMETVEISNYETVDKALENYKNNECIKSVQPNFVYKLETSTSSPASINDTKIDKQYYLNKLNIDKAWNYLSTKSVKRVKVGIIDTGVSANHPDLKSNIYLSKDATNSMKDTTKDKWFHGTHVTGIIGATTNNSKGIVGIVQNNADLICINVFHKGYDEYGDPTYYAYTSDMIKAYKYAVQKGVQVINMSLGRLVDEYLYQDTDKYYDNLFEKEIDKAAKDGIVTVCAAGNDNSSLKFYPADFESCISVININKKDEKAWDSNYGTKKDISAYGVDIYSTVPYSSSYGYKYYDYRSGTSMATPMVTGVVALMKCLNPYISTENVKKILYETAVDIGRPGKDSYTGYGKVDALAAVKAVKKNLSKPTINTITAAHTKVTGTASKNSTIRVYNSSGSLIAKTTATEKGTYSVNIPKQKGGTKIKVKSSKSGYFSREVTKTVLKVFSSTLTGSNVYTSTTKISGKGCKYATIRAYVNGKQIGSSTTVKSTGKYTLTIPKQKKGKVITIKMSKSGYAAKTIKRTVR